jgi:hypothetical protein
MRLLPLEQLRQAVNSGEFGRAQLLWTECAAGLAGELSSGHLSAARFSEVRELVEWSRMVVLCERAHLQSRLNSLHIAGEYELNVPPPAHRIVAASF